MPLVPVDHDEVVGFTCVVSKMSALYCAARQPSAWTDGLCIPDGHKHQQFSATAQQGEVTALK